MFCNKNNDTIIFIKYKLIVIFSVSCNKIIRFNSDYNFTIVH